MFRTLLNLSLPILVLWASVSTLRRKRRGEELGNLGFRPVSPGGNPLFAPIHFGGGEAKIEYVDEMWRGGSAPPFPDEPDGSILIRRTDPPTG